MKGNEMINSFEERIVEKAQGIVDAHSSLSRAYDSLLLAALGSDGLGKDVSKDIVANVLYTGQKIGVINIKNVQTIAFEQDIDRDLLVFMSFVNLTKGTIHPLVHAYQALSDEKACEVLVAMVALLDQQSSIEKASASSL